MKVVLTQSTETGLQEIPLDGETISFGRGTEADYRFDDDGLSRLHATVFRDGDRIWVVDDNSTNGTFVNGQPVESSGMPLHNGDSIRIGNYTTLKVKFVEESTTTPTTESKAKVAAVSGSKSGNGLLKLIPIAAILLAVFVIGISAIVVAVKIFVKPPPIVANRNDDFPTPDDRPTKTESPTTSPTQKSTTAPTGTPLSNDNSTSGTTNLSSTKLPDIPVPSGKKYGEMSEDEKTKYVEVKLAKIAAIIGNRSSNEAIPPDAVARIKKDVKGYFDRIRSSRSDGCTGATWLKSDTATIFERASKNVPFINRAFSQEGVGAEVGIYIAMIESEHCPCLQSGTGPLGMFQFATATAKSFFENPNGIVKGSKPPVGDDRCKPEIAARGSAKYVKYLTGFFGTGPASFPLAIAAYNSGEGGMQRNLKKALDADPSLSRDFWTLIANSDKLSEQFRTENFHYPPKFFAAAIIGENPQDFGLNLQPLSTYTK